MISQLGIVNGNRFSVQDGALEIPDMRETLDGASRPLSFIRVTTEIVNFEAKQVERPLETFGIMQPLSLRELMMKPEDERSWKWMVLFANTDLALKNDDVIIRAGQRFRIMGNWDWSDSGYFRYEMVEDYDNATTARR